MKSLNLNLKKNQIIVFVIALMLVSAGYLSYTVTDIELVEFEETIILNFASNLPFFNLLSKETLKMK